MTIGLSCRDIVGETNKEEPMSGQPPVPTEVLSASEARSLLLKNYDVHTDLLKFYLDLVVKANTFHYAVTGAIVSYCLAHSSEPLVRLALWLPVLMSIGNCWLFAFGAKQSVWVTQELRNIGQALGYKVIPDARVLTAALAVAAILCGLVAVGVAVLALR